MAICQLCIGFTDTLLNFQIVYYELEAKIYLKCLKPWMDPLARLRAKKPVDKPLFSLNVSHNVQYIGSFIYSVAISLVHRCITEIDALSNRE